MDFVTADIVVLIVILFFALIGLIKGFVKTIISFCKGFLSLVIAYFLAPTFATILQGTAINDNIYNRLLNWTSTKGELFTQPIPEGGISQVVGDQLNLPQFLINFLNSIIGTNDNVDVLEGMTLGQFISDTLSYYILLIIAFFVLSILARIILAIIAKILTKLVEEEGALRFINRLIGFIIGLLKGVLVVSIVFWLLGFLSSWFTGIDEMIVNMINPDNPNFGIARWLYNNNFLDFIIHKMLDTEQFVPAA